MLAPAGHGSPSALSVAPSLEQTIRDWDQADQSQRAIAREFNLDRRKVKRILNQAAGSSSSKRTEITYL